ncbi:TspO/MBR family-domain-containing protein [Ustulina deusta]|nr:TspO/MBR family-domain-containing protein [Ustulina deusta]
MTTYIPKITTIPYDVFASPSASILLPIALGTSVGYSTRRKLIPCVLFQTDWPKSSGSSDPGTRVLVNAPNNTTAKQTKETYNAMKQPPLRPPPYVFGPAWTALYGLMGYAAHRAVTRASSVSFSSSLPVSAEGLRALYSAQLGLNLAWMPLFFGLRRPALAFANIVSLVGINGYLTYLYFGIDEVSGWCMVPYLAWLGFATYLNAGVGYLNRWDISESTLATRKALGKDE